MTVQAVILRLLVRIDPKLKSGTLITSSNISTWSTDGGDKFTSQRIMDIYNEARLALANAIERYYPPKERARTISGTLKKKTDLQFTSGVASKSSITGYIKYERLFNAAGTQITILPVSEMQETEDLNSASNPIVYDYTTSFAQKTPDTAIIADASTYVLWYHGITNYTLSNVTAGTEVEEFNEDWIPAILQIAEAIAMEQGTKAVNALAQQLVYVGK